MTYFEKYQTEIKVSKGGLLLNKKVRQFQLQAVSNRLVKHSREVDFLVKNMISINNVESTNYFQFLIFIVDIPLNMKLA